MLACLESARLVYRIVWPFLAIVLHVVIQCFYFTLQQVKEKIATDEFKPNCALVVLDFMIRHGLVTPDSGELLAFVMLPFL